MNSVVDNFWAFISNSAFPYYHLEISLSKIIFIFSSYLEENLNFKSHFLRAIYYTLFFLTLAVLGFPPPLVCIQQIINCSNRQRMKYTVYNIWNHIELFSLKRCAILGKLHNLSIPQNSYL